MYHMGDQPTSFPEEFELSEDSEEIEMEYFGRVLRVQEERVEGESVQEESVQEFWIGDGTGSKIPKVDSPTKRYPPFSVGMVYEHNDEELTEPDLEPGEIWEDSEYGSDQEQDLFGDEDSGPPNAQMRKSEIWIGKRW